MSLVSAQLALALVLAVGASLLLESFLRVRSVDPGFEPEGLLAFSMPMKRLGSLDQASWMAWDDLVREVAAIPGVRVAAGSNLPFQSPNWGPGVLLPGEPLETRRDGIAGYAITPPYFDVLGIPLLVGRRFASADGPEGEAVAIVNERFVQQVLGGGVAIGQEIFFRTDEEGRESRRIVGVVGDVIQTRAEEVKGPAVYVPYTQADWPYNTHVAVRTERLPSEVAGELRQAANRFSPAVPVRDLSPMVARIGVTRTEPRFQALLLGSFALVAVLLSAVGLYGTLAHMVGRRTRELGIRMALGADRGRIIGLVVRQGIAVTGAGMVVGLAGALLLTRFLGGFLFQIGSLHPPSFAWAALALCGVAVAAAVAPAFRATRVDVVGSLSAE